MKPCRKKVPLKTRLAIVSVLAVAAAAVASGGYLARERGRAVPADGGSFAGIAPIYRQILVHGGDTTFQAEPAPFGGESMRRPAAAFLRIENYAPGDEIEAIPQTGAPASGPRRRAATYVPAARMRGAAQMSETGGRSFALVFNGSFASLFADLFDSRDAMRPSAAGEDRNPFTEAKEEERAARPATPAEAQPPKAEKPEAPEPPAPEAAKQSGNPAVAGQAAAEDVFIFLGDFDGSGVLSTVEARRAGENEFDFGGITKSFRLLVNPAAVADQRSLGIDDVDGDGIMDMVVTSRASLFGALLLGDSGGGFRGAGFFPTGYEPTVATFGSMTEEGREILAVNLRTGVVTSFRRRGSYYGQYRAARLDVPPDYVAHVVELASGLDYLLAGREGMQPYLYRLMGDSRCEPVPERLPDAPAIDLGPGLRRGNAAGGLRVYQVGSYASVILSDTAGLTFNVANLRVVPGLFLVFGNLESRGSLDVGVAYLISQAHSR